MVMGQLSGALGCGNPGLTNCSVLGPQVTPAWLAGSEPRSPPECPDIREQGVHREGVWEAGLIFTIEPFVYCMTKVS